MYIWAANQNHLNNWIEKQYSSFEKEQGNTASSHIQEV